MPLLCERWFPAFPAFHILIQHEKVFSRKSRFFTANQKLKMICLLVMLWARFVFSCQCCVMALSLCIVCTKITKHTLTFPFWTLGVRRRESTADRPQNIRRPVETVISSYARVMLLNRSTRYICCVYYSINHLTPTQSRYFQAKFKIKLYML